MEKTKVIIINASGLYSLILFSKFVILLAYSYFCSSDIPIGVKFNIMIKEL